MEIKKFLLNFALVSSIMSCSNAPEMETGEIRLLKTLEQAWQNSNKSRLFIDSRTLLSRKQIDEVNTPILFVELESGQNGTLTPYPGKGVGQTWLAADGATVTLERGILKASRGMGNDLMGSSSLMPSLSEVNENIKIYSREISHITGNNKIYTRIFKCRIQKINKKEIIKVWDVDFFVTKFQEICDHNGFEIQNIFYLDKKNIVRRSSQYHSDTVGYITLERLDR